MTGLATYDNLFFKSKSVRKRTIKITDGKEFEETKEGLSFKKIIKSVKILIVHLQKMEMVLQK